jgi:hypothetical protein
MNGDQSSKPDRRKLPQAQFLFINQSSNRSINPKVVHYISPNMVKNKKLSKLFVCACAELTCRIGAKPASSPSPGSPQESKQLPAAGTWQEKSKFRS